LKSKSGESSIDYVLSSSSFQHTVVSSVAVSIIAHQASWLIVFFSSPQQDRNSEVSGHPWPLWPRCDLVFLVVVSSWRVVIGLGCCHTDVVVVLTRWTVSNISKES